MSKEIRNILVDLQNQYPADKWDIDNAMKQIKKIVEGVVPKKLSSENEKTREFDAEDYIVNLEQKAYDACIKEIKKNIAELFDDK